MLSIHFGEMEEANYGPTWFQFNYDINWFEDPFVQQMTLAIDKTTYEKGAVFNSPVLGPIPPERLSGGLKTLIMIYERPELIFDATSCGENCAPWLLKIGNMKNVTVELKYLMPFREEPFEINIMNERKIVHTFREYVFSAVQYI